MRTRSRSPVATFVLVAVVSGGAAGCAPSALLEVERTRPGSTGARATGRFPDIQAVPRRAARQLDANTYADIASELNRDAAIAAGRAPVRGRAADRRAAALVAEAEAEERRRREAIRTRNRVAPSG